MSDTGLVEAMLRVKQSISPKRHSRYHRDQMTRKSLISKALGISASFLFLGGCEQAEEEQSPSGQNQKASIETQPVDASNPTEVAQAFITAIAEKDFKTAVEYVAPDQRDELEKALGEAIPPLPAKPDIQVRVKENGVQADVAVLNTEEPRSGPPFGLDMSLIDGKWWIVK